MSSQTDPHTQQRPGNELAVVRQGSFHAPDPQNRALKSWGSFQESTSHSQSHESGPRSIRINLSGTPGGLGFSSRTLENTGMQGSSLTFRVNSAFQPPSNPSGSTWQGNTRSPTTSPTPTPMQQSPHESSSGWNQLQASSKLPAAGQWSPCGTQPAGEPGGKHPQSPATTLSLNTLNHPTPPPHSHSQAHHSHHQHQPFGQHISSGSNIVTRQTQSCPCCNPNGGHGGQHAQQQQQHGSNQHQHPHQHSHQHQSVSTPTTGPIPHNGHESPAPLSLAPPNAGRSTHSTLTHSHSQSHTHPQSYTHSQPPHGHSDPSSNSQPYPHSHAPHHSLPPSASSSAAHCHVAPPPSSSYFPRSNSTPAFVSSAPGQTCTITNAPPPSEYPSWAPFTVSQWQELEHQALIFKYLVAGQPVPLDLVATLHNSHQLQQHQHQQQHMHHPNPHTQHMHQPSHAHAHHPHSHYSSMVMPTPRTGVHLPPSSLWAPPPQVDLEPYRCRRTDGKKWRCSLQVVPDQKYCEKHMHRGRNRARKLADRTTAGSSADGGGGAGGEGEGTSGAAGASRSAGQDNAGGQQQQQGRNGGNQSNQSHQAVATAATASGTMPAPVPSGSFNTPVSVVPAPAPPPSNAFGNVVSGNGRGSSGTEQLTGTGSTTTLSAPSSIDATAVAVPGPASAAASGREGASSIAAEAAAAAVTTPLPCPKVKTEAGTVAVGAHEPASALGAGMAAVMTAAGSTPVPPTPSPSMPIAPMASLQTPCKEEQGGGMADDSGTAKVLSLTPLAGSDTAAATGAATAVSQIGIAAGEIDAGQSGGVQLAAVIMQAEQRDGKVEACRLPSSQQCPEQAVPPCILDSSLELVGGGGKEEGRVSVGVVLGRAGSDVVMAEAGGEGKSHGFVGERLEWRGNKENEALNVQLTPSPAEGGLHGRPSPKCVLQQGSCRSDSSGTTSPVEESPPVPVAPLEERAEQLQD